MSRVAKSVCVDSVDAGPRSRLGGRGEEEEGEEEADVEDAEDRVVGCCGGDAVALTARERCWQYEGRLEREERRKRRSMGEGGGLGGIVRCSEVMTVSKYDRCVDGSTSSDCQYILTRYVCLPGGAENPRAADLISSSGHVAVAILSPPNGPLRVPSSDPSNARQLVD